MATKPFSEYTREELEETILSLYSTLVDLQRIVGKPGSGKLGFDANKVPHLINDALNLMLDKPLNIFSNKPAARK